MQAHPILNSSHYLVHVSNTILIFAFAVRDILWLRILAVIAGLVIIPYYLFQPTPLWEAIAWTVVFILIHAVNIWLILLDRRPVKLTRDEEKLHGMAFKLLDRRNFVKILRIGEWQNLPKGEKVIINGVPITDVKVLLSGKVTAYMDGQFVSDLKPGSMVGNMGMLIGNPPTFDVIVSEPVRCMNWRLSELNAFVERHPDIRIALRHAVSRDLAKKLHGFVFEK